jgi:outer membrane protein assembly factor BamB
MKKMRTVALVLAAVLALAGCDWTMFHGGPSGSSLAVDAGFTPAHLASAVRQWRFHPGGSIAASPVTFGGRVFLGGGNGVFYALDENSGAVLWQRNFGTQPVLECTTSPVGFVSTAAVRGDGNGHPLVYVYATNGHLLELNGLTGATVWDQLVQAPSPDLNDVFPWSSPVLAHGKVYIGVSSNCDTPFVTGGVKSFDQATGRPIAAYTTMPAGYVGAGVWTSVVVDSSSVYLTTGSTYDTTNAAHPATDTNSFDQYSMLKLDAETLTKTGKWAIPQPELIGDADWGSSPVLFDATVAGQSTPLVGACNKNGAFYALRRDTMRPVWETHVGLGTPAGEVGCLSGGIWDGARLFVAGNDTATGGTWTPSIVTSPGLGYSWLRWTATGGTSFAGSVRRIDPATGAVLWERGLRSRALGSGSMNGAKTLLAFQTTDWTSSFNGCELLDPNNATAPVVLHDDAEYPGFSSPIWSDGRLIVADTDAIRAYR